MIEWENCPTNGGMSPLSLEARDEDYDTYLFWPSLSNGMGTSKESFVATYHTSTPPSSDQVDYYSGWDTAPSSPLSLTSPSEFHFPTPCGNKTLENGLPEGQPNGVQEKGSLPKYCRTFRMGLLLIRAARHVDRAVQSVGITLRKNKTEEQAVQKAHTRDH